MNLDQLVMVAVVGEVASPTQDRTGNRDGIAGLLPGPGGIVISHRIGALCVGLAADRLTPGVAIENRQRALRGRPDAANLALNGYVCIGNLARVVSGPCAGRRGIVTGKVHGVNQVSVDFADPVIRRLRLGDRIQVYAHGMGLKLLDHAELRLFNCSPPLLRRWGLRSRSHRLAVPVAHRVPGRIMVTGVCAQEPCPGHTDLPLADPATRHRYRLDRLRFGDLIAVEDLDGRSTATKRPGYTTIGVITHGDSPREGHGPGLIKLMTGPDYALEPIHDPTANLARILELRPGIGRTGRFPRREAAGALRITTRFAPAAAPEELAGPRETVHWSLETCS
ncbi:DUF4438 domain-containing protein [Thioalkalicoccus limnaeus]|uniref:DUF4438 domain-containing protein n=1 Tax=Thioalkalicoccus limnaeus TaxID=120681 RepID=A0ABV4BDE1_9GAMM